MAEKQQSNNSFKVRISARWKENLRLIVRVLAGRVMRGFLLLIAAGVVGGLAYMEVWRPLQREVQLPAGVPVSNPMIDRTLLQRLSEGLTIRRRHVPTSYFRATTIFSRLLPGVVPAVEQTNDQSQQ